MPMLTPMISDGSSPEVLDCSMGASLTHRLSWQHLGPTYRHGLCPQQWPDGPRAMAGLVPAGKNKDETLRASKCRGRGPDPRDPSTAGLSDGTYELRECYPPEYLLAKVLLASPWRCCESGWHLFGHGCRLTFVGCQCSVPAKKREISTL